GSAPEALHELEASKPNILISDIGLPGIDGYTLLRNIRDLEQKQGSSPVPAIALTAYAGADDRQNALEAGYQVHLAKPVDLPDSSRQLAGPHAPCRSHGLNRLMRWAGLDGERGLSQKLIPDPVDGDDVLRL